MDTKKINILKYVTFVALLIRSINNMYIGIRSMCGARADNFSFVWLGCLIAESIGIILIAIWIIKSDDGFLAFRNLGFFSTIIFVAVNCTVQFIRIKSEVHFQLYCNEFLLFFGILTMLMIIVNPRIQDSALLFISILCFAYVIITDMLRFSSISLMIIGYKPSWFSIVMTFISLSSLILICVWFGIKNKLFKKNEIIKNILIAVVAFAVILLGVKFIPQLFRLGYFKPYTFIVFW